MNTDGTKLVNFEFCNTCIHRTSKEDEDPCHSCLNESVNLYSERPVNYSQDFEETKRLLKLQNGGENDNRTTNRNV